MNNHTSLQSEQLYHLHQLHWTGVAHRLRLVLLLGLAGLAVAGCALTLPEPPQVNLPTQPAVLHITPAPTLDVDATATAMADMLRPTPTPAGLYIIQAGDTLSELAVRYNTTVEEILVANGLSNPNDIQVGQAIIIPSLLPSPVLEAAPSEAQTAPAEAEITPDGPQP